MKRNNFKTKPVTDDDERMHHVRGIQTRRKPRTFERSRVHVCSLDSVYPFLCSMTKETGGRSMVRDDEISPYYIL